ncbi:MAG: hypothetical protein JSR77_07465 [Planctomycetes bacterium]|nr:hypothetical protein [Planctomycetota bacterium]
MRRIKIAAAAIAACLTVACTLGITAGRAPVATDARFDAVAGFTRFEWRDINNVFGNATLISSDRVVLARHLINENYKTRTSVDPPASDYMVRFRRKPDGSLGDVNDPTTFYQVRVKEWILPQTRGDVDDIAIGVLETPVTHIRPMPIDLKPRLGKNVRAIIASWGPESAPQGAVVPKGRLLIGDVMLRTPNSAWIALSPKTTKTPSEVVLNDSGAPLLVPASSGYKMIGMATTTAGGVSLSTQQGTRLFPRSGR